MTVRPAASNRLLRKHIRAALALPAAALLTLGIPVTVWAEPTGGIVVSGQATISAPAPGTTVIEQGSQDLQLNWNTFNLAANESVQFQQPSSSAVALNRILDQNPSQIFGRIDANGKVILVNPNGLLFGQSAQLNVGSLVASSLDVVDFDAASGRYTFGASRADVGAVINEGYITAGPSGSVTLLGSRVTNTGSIVASFGTVNLAAGRAATLDLAGDGLLQLEVDEQLVAGGAAAVENSGSIQADGGQVLLSAKALDGVLANLVNNTGLVRANRIENSGGTIRLVGTGGTVRSSGTLDASAGDADSTGGRVEVLGEQVGLFGNARVDVSGATDGGTALIGGDYQGKNPEVPNAARTYISADAIIEANAGTTGDGGKVIVWADELTRYGGHISARGGTQSGDGGFAEVSGKESLAFTGTADLSASQGTGGTLLLDPLSITIVAGNDTDSDIDDGQYTFAEDAGIDATIGAGTIEQLLSTGLNVSLQATNSIVQSSDADINVSGEGGAAGAVLTLQAADIALGGDILLNGGAFNALATNSVLLQGAIATNANVQVTGSSGSVTMADGSSIAAGTGPVQIAAGLDARVTQITTSNSVAVTAQGSIVDDGNDNTRINAHYAYLSGAGIGQGANGAVDTQVTDLRFEGNGTGGSVFIVESDNVQASGFGVNINVSTIDGGITANSIGGDDVTLTAAGASSDITLNGTISATDIYSTIVLNAGRSVIGGAAYLLRAYYLQAGASSIGAPDARLNTDVDEVNLQATQGDAYVTELDHLLLTASAPNGHLDVISTNGNINIYFGLTAQSANLTANNGTLGNFNAVPFSVNVGSLTLTGNSVGHVANPYDMNVGSLSVTTDTGGVYLIDGADGIALTSISSAGPIGVTSAGSVTVGNVSSNDSVSITSHTGAILDDGDDGTLLQGSSVTLSAQTSLGTVTNFTAASNALIGNSLDIQTNGALALGLNNDNGQINVNLGGTPTVAAGAIRLGNAAVDRAGSIVLHSTGNLDLSGFANGAIDIGPGNTTSISLRSDATLILPPGGAITNQPADLLSVRGTTDVIESDGDPRVIALTANHLVFSSGSLGGATILNTSVDRLDAQLTTGSFVDRDLTVNEANDVTLGTVAASGAGSLAVYGGAITDDGEDSTRIIGNNVTLSGTSLGAFGNALGTQATLLTVTATGGGAYISESDFVNVTANTAGLWDLQTLAGSIVVNASTVGGANLTAGGDFSSVHITNVLDAGTSDVTLTAGTADARGIINAGNINNRIIADDLTMVSHGTSNAALNTTVSSLTANDIGGGSLYILETDALDLSADGTGHVQVETNGGLLTVNAVRGDSTLLRSGGSMHIAGSIEVATLADLFVASTGSITDGTGGTRITASTLRLNDGTFGSAGNALDTNATTLFATSTAPASGLFVAEQDGLTLNTVNVLTDVSVSSATGNITVNTVTAGDTATLTATAGAILDDGNDATRISAPDGIALSAGTGIGTVTDFAAFFASSIGSTLDVQTSGALSAAVTSNTGAMNLLISGTPTIAAGAISLGGSSGGNGTVVLQSAGNLDFAGLSVGAISLGTNNTTRVGLIAQNTLTLPSNVGFMAQPAGLLRIRASQVVDSDSGATDLVLAANTLDFVSSVASTANFTTDTELLNVTLLGSSGALTVSEANDIALGSVFSSARVTINANGAITDDGNDNTVLFGANSGLGPGFGLTLSGQSIGANGNAVDVVGSHVNLVASNGSMYADLVSDTYTTASATGSIHLRSVNTHLRISGDLNAGNGVTLTADGANSRIDLLGNVNGGTGTVTLTAGTPSARGNVLTDLRRISGSSLIIDAANVGSNGIPLLTTVDSLNVTATGNVYVAEFDALNLTANTSGDVQLSAGGSIVAGFVSGAAVNLTASGTITDGASNSPAIVGNSVTLFGTSIGTSSNALDTQVTSLNLTATSGGAYIREADGLAVRGAASGAVDVRTTLGDITAGTGGFLRGFEGVTLTTGSDGGDIVIDGSVYAANGAVRLIAGEGSPTPGAITRGMFGQIESYEIIATGSTIGSSSAYLFTNANVVNLSAPGGIYAFGIEDMRLSANAGGGTVGTVDFFSNGALTVDTVNATTATLDALEQPLTIAGSIRADQVTLRAGAINDVTSTAPSVIADDLVLNADHTGSSSNPLNVQVGTLNASGTPDELGDPKEFGIELNIAAQDALRLGTIKMTGDTSISAAGNLTVGTVTVGGTAALSSGSSIMDDGDGSTIIDAGGIALTAANNIGTVTNIDASTGADIGSAITVRTGGELQARSTSNVGRINLQIEDLAPVVLASGISVGTGSGASGLIALHADEDLDLSGLAPGAISSGTNSQTTVLLRAGNVLTLPTVGTYTSTSLSRLVIRGADVVDGDTTPHTLSLQANRLDFRSAGTHDTTLNTNAGQLDVTVSDGQSLTVNEANGVTLGAISAAGGSVSITAVGAIVDDNNAATRIVSDSAFLSGSSIGVGNNAVDTQVATLSATATGGSIVIDEVDALQLTASASGAVIVQTLNGVLSAGDISSTGMSLTAGGAGNGILIDGTLNSGFGNVTLLAGTPTNRGTIQATADSFITGGLLNATGSSLGTSSERLNTGAGLQTLTATNGGIFVTATQDAFLTAHATNGVVDIRVLNGSLLAQGISGTNITLDIAGNDAALFVQGSMNAGTGDIVLTAGNGTLYGSGGVLSASSLTATARSIIGLSTSVDSLNLTSTAGGINVTEADDVTLTATASGGETSVLAYGTLTAGSVTGDGVSLLASGSGHDLVLNGIVDAGSGDASFLAGRSVIAGAGHHVIADSLDISSFSSIGSNTARLNTTVNSLQANNSGGGIFVSETDALEAGAFSFNSTVDIETSNGALSITDVYGHDVILTAGGDGSGIAINGYVTAASGEALLTAGTANERGVITAGANGTVRADSLVASASGIGDGTAALNTEVDSLDLSATNGGIYIREADLVSVNATATGAIDIRTTNGDLDNLATRGEGVTLVAGGANRNLVLFGNVDAGSGNVTLTASDAITVALGVSVTGNVLTASAASIGSSEQRLNTSVASLNATSSNGSIYVTETDALTLAAGASDGVVDAQTVNGAINVTSVTTNRGVTLLAGGDGSGITVNGAMISEGNDVTLTAGTDANRGAIAAGTGNQVSGATVTLAGSSIGSSAARLNTAATTLNATSTNGGIFVTETDASSLNANATGGPVDVRTTNGALTVASATGDGVTLIAGGAGSGITLTGAVNAGAGDVTLTAGTPATGGAIAGGTGHRVSGNSLTVSGSSIGASPIAPLQTNVAALTATASNGSMYISEQNDLTLMNLSASGAVDVVAAGNVIVGAVNATGNVFLSGPAIVDDGNDATRVTGDLVVLEADSIGTTARRLSTNATRLNAFADTGGIFIEELNGLQRFSLDAGSNIELISLDGDLNLSSVTAGGTLLLSAAGNILAIAGSTGIVASDAELRAGTVDSSRGQIGTFSQPLDVELDAGETLRLFVPVGVSPNDLNRAPAIAPSAGVTMTLSAFSAPSTLATLAGFGQFQGLNETSFTSPQPDVFTGGPSPIGPILALIGPSWIPLDPNTSLLSTSDVPVCLPPDQRREEADSTGC